MITLLMSVVQLVILQFPKMSNKKILNHRIKILNYCMPHVCLWWIHFDIWQNQYNIVKFKNKIKLKKYIELEFVVTPAL